MMDYIAGLAARGLISPDVLQGLVQQINDIRNKPPGIGSVPLEGGGRGIGPPGGASGKPVVVPDPANQNMTPRDQFIDEYDALIRKRAAQENQADMKANNKARNRFDELLSKKDQ